MTLLPLLFTVVVDAVRRLAAVTLPHRTATLALGAAGTADRDGQARPLRAGASGCLVATGGGLWVTVHGRPDDHLLAHGQWLAVQRGQVLWIGACGHAAAGWRFVPARGRDAAVAAGTGAPCAG